MQHCESSSLRAPNFSRHEFLLAIRWLGIDVKLSSIMRDSLVIAHASLRLRICEASQSAVLYIRGCRFQLRGLV